MVKERKLRWYGHISRSSGMAKTVLQGTVKGARKRGRQKKRWEDRRRDGKIISRNGQEWGLEIPWGQRKTGKDWKVMLQRHLWCPDDRRVKGLKWEMRIVLLTVPRRYSRTAPDAAHVYLTSTQVYSWTQIAVSAQNKVGGDIFCYCCCDKCVYNRETKHISDYVEHRLTNLVLNESLDFAL